MPRVRVLYIGWIRTITRRREDELLLPEDSTVEQVLDLLANRYGARFKDGIQHTDRSLRDGVIVLVNGQDVVRANGLKTALKEGAEVNIVMGSALAGG